MSTGNNKNNTDFVCVFLVVAKSTDCPADLELDGVEFFLLEMVPQHVPVAPILLQSKLSESKAPHATVTWGHAQGAAPLRGHADEALPPAEIVNCHALKVHIAPPDSL